MFTRGGTPSRRGRGCADDPSDLQKYPKYASTEKLYTGLKEKYSYQGNNHLIEMRHDTTKGGMQGRESSGRGGMILVPGELSEPV